MASNASSAKIETIVALCKRRGFVFASGEIYGGTRSAWDYGPLGVELKENIKRQWWKAMVTGREDVVGLDSSVILPRQVWVASGHVSAFHDPLVECTNCHKRFRADQLAEEYAERTGKAATEDDLSDVPCPNCGTRGQYTEPRDFNMMLKTYLGPVESEEGLHYLRPETAQGIFVNFLNVQTTVARASPRSASARWARASATRSRPATSSSARASSSRWRWSTSSSRAPTRSCTSTGSTSARAGTSTWASRRENLRHYEHPKEKLSHYSKRTVDIEYRFGFTGQEWGELEGIANRTDFDLTTHSNHSGVDLSFYDQASGTRYRPVRHRARRGRRALDDGVPGRGLRRGRGAQRQGRRRQARGAAAGPPPGARSRPRCCRCRATPTSRPRPATSPPRCARNWNVDFDDAGAIGRRYRRQDEIGTPFCVTVDFDTLTDQAVTIRERDTMAQERVALDQVESYLAARLPGC